MPMEVCGMFPKQGLFQCSQSAGRKTGRWSSDHVRIQQSESRRRGQSVMLLLGHAIGYCFSRKMLVQPIFAWYFVLLKCLLQTASHLLLNTTWRWRWHRIFGPIFNQKTFLERVIDFPKSYKKVVVWCKRWSINSTCNDVFQWPLVIEVRLTVLEVSLQKK